MYSFFLLFRGLRCVSRIMPFNFMLCEYPYLVNLAQEFQFSICLFVTGNPVKITQRLPFYCVQRRRRLPNLGGLCKIFGVENGLHHQDLPFRTPFWIMHTCISTWSPRCLIQSERSIFWCHTHKLSYFQIILKQKNFIKFICSNYNLLLL